MLASECARLGFADVIHFEPREYGNKVRHDDE